MKQLILIIIALIGFSSVFSAVEPAISYNVHVIQNASPGQCQPSMRNDTGPGDTQNNTRFGQLDTSNPGVRSCTGCAIDSQSGDCVCRTCYTHYMAY